MSTLIFYILTTLSMILCTDLCRIEWRRRSPFIVFWLALLAIVFLPSLLDPFRGIVSPHVFASDINLSDDLLIEYALFIFVVMLFFRFMYMLFDHFTLRRVCAPLASNLDKVTKASVYVYIGLVVASLYAFYEVYRKYGIGFVDGFDFEDRRTGLSLISGFLLSYSYMVSAGLGVWLFMRRKYYSFVFVLAFYAASYLLFGGSRQPIVAFFIPLILYPAMGKEKRSALKLVLILGSTLLFSDILNALLYLRNLPSFSDRLDLLMDFPRLMTEATSREGGEDMVRYAFYFFLDNARYIDGYFHFQYFGRFCLFWLPSSLDFLSIKPDDFEYFMFSKFMNGQVGSMHPTVFGAIYADSGWIFMPWVITLSFLLYYLPIYIQRFSGLIYICLWSTFCFYSLMFARGSLYGSAVVIFFAILIAFFANFLGRVRMVNRGFR